jgi:DNA-binding NarL/FixJ family response regulator
VASREGKTIRVVIADDHGLFVDALRMLLEAGGGVEVVGAAPTGLDAVHLALERDADLVLMDVTMPGIDGFEATRRLLSIRPATRVIILSGLDREELEREALAAGAIAFLPKDRVLHDLDAAIDAAFDAPEPPAAFAVAVARARVWIEGALAAGPGQPAPVLG